MNTKTFVILGIIVLIIGVGYITTQSPASENALTSDKGSAEMSDSDTMTNDTEPMTDETMDAEAAPAESAAGPGNYTDYSTEAVANSDADTKLMFFHATWCPSCRALENDITDSLGDIPSDVTIFKADYDSEIALRQTHGVTVQHTIVQIDDAGNQIKKWSGANTLEGVLAEL